MTTDPDSIVSSPCPACGGLEKLHTVEDAARLLGVHTSTIGRLVRTGDITHTRIGRRVLFSRAHLNDFIAANTYSSISNPAPVLEPRPWETSYEQLLAERMELIRTLTAKRIPVSERDFRSKQ